MTKKSTEGITVKKDENFSEWFTQLMIKADLADYSSVSGCIIFKPRSYAIWEKIVSECDKEFKKIGIQNVYFPIFIPENLLTKEEEHIEDFAPEVAWVTHGGNKELGERLAVRPTSEAIMYDSYSKWIRSWRDLPIRYNQWNNVVRWEFKNPVPFFRTREFLWNEGHTAFANEKEALAEEKPVLSIYDKFCANFMALPGIIGKKTEKEKFAGAVFSKKIHYMTNAGKVIEGPCFHHDGQKFAKAYDIKFIDKDEKEKLVWQNTWAITTRMLGVMFTVHSDDKGLVIPPKLAPEKIVLVPILIKGKEEKVIKKIKDIAKDLKQFNPILDERDNLSPGRKFSEWELKGIPLRLELGPKDLEKESVTLVKRNTGEKIEVKIKDLKKEIPSLLNTIQEELLNNATKILNSKQKKTEDKKELIKFVKEKNMVNIPLCNNEACEDKMKEETTIKTLFIDPKKTSTKGKKCLICGKPADYWVYVGKSY